MGKKLAVLFVICFFWTAPTIAANYGMAGCGLGSVILKGKPGKVQLFAATTNDYFSQTSAITTGTSNCSDGPREMASLFIIINQEALMADIARGQGETIANLAKIYSCQDTNYFIEKFRENYKLLQVDPKELKEVATQAIYQLLIKDRYLLETCNELS